jgi:hypothetical protein
MTAFEMVALAVSFILGLGITSPLSSCVVVFRGRRQYRIHWVPAVWVLCIFILQIQFWWSLFGLSPWVEVWTLTRFGLLLICALTLFLAGALVLPGRRSEYGEDLLRYLQGDGRWGLAALGAYHAEAFVLNWLLFGSGPGHLQSVPIWVGLGLVAGTLATKRRGAQFVLTALFLINVIVGVAVMSTPAYQ